MKNKGDSRFNTHDWKSQSRRLQNFLYSNLRYGENPECFTLFQLLPFKQQTFGKLDITFWSLFLNFSYFFPKVLVHFNDWYTQGSIGKWVLFITVRVVSRFSGTVSYVIFVTLLGMTWAHLNSHANPFSFLRTGSSLKVKLVAGMVHKQKACITHKIRGPITCIEGLRGN